MQNTRTHNKVQDYIHYALNVITTLEHGMVLHMQNLLIKVCATIGRKQQEL